MDWRVALGIASGIFGIGSNVPYIRDMLRGQTKPNVVSYIIWLTLDVISFAAEWNAGLSWSIVILAAAVLNGFMIVALSLGGYGYKEHNWVDWSCLALGIIALFFWWATNNPLTALVLTLIASILADIPTVAKTYREPRTELALAWFIGAFAGFLAIFSAAKWDAANLIFPVYFLLEGAAIGGLAYFRKA
jgi:hypothetical protein